MLNVLITGAAGMVGQKLARRIARDATLAGGRVRRVTLVDVVPAAVPPTPSEVEFVVQTGDLRQMETAERWISAGPDTIFHLAAIVSGEAEKDFDKGYAINLDGTRNLLEAIRLAGIRPRFVFASSIAVFGAPFPEAIPDDFFCTPLTSYGTQKAIGELLVTDYSRREILDGISLRLPTICVRPRTPQRRRIRVLFQHHPRTSGRPRSRVTGRRRCPALARQPSRRGPVHASRRSA